MDVSCKKLLWPSSNRVLPVFSPRSLMESCLTFTSFIHFEFYLCVRCERMVQFYSSACGCPTFPAAFSEEAVFFPVDGLSCLVEYMVLTVELRVHFWISLFCPIDPCVCFSASSTLSWWAQLCSTTWSPALWCRQLWFSFLILPWAFGVLSDSTLIFRWFVATLWREPLVFLMIGIAINV